MSTVAQLCAALVRVRTEEPRPTGPAIAICAEALKAAGFRLRRQVETVPGIVHALFERDGDGPPLLLDGHLDTVPCGESSAWRCDPVGGEIADGAVWGRGAADDKGPIAAAIMAVTRYTGSRRLLFSLCNDEEQHMRGIQAIMQDDAVQAATQAIALEPTSLAPVHAHKGNARIRVEVTGQPGHASRPDLGRNAIEEKLRLIATVQAWFIAGEGQRRLDAFGQEPGTLVVTREVTPNAAYNVIPDRADYWYNYRPLPEGDRPFETLLARVAAEAEAVALPVRTEVEFLVPPFLTPTDVPLIRAITATTGRTPEWAPYGTHAGYLADGQREVVVFGPGDIAVVHRENEHIPVQTLEDGVDALLGVLHRLS